MKKENNISETAAFTRQRRAKRTILFLTVPVVFCVLITSVVFGAIMYARGTTEPVDDPFEPAVVTCQVTEGAKGAFTVTNTGNVPVYN